MGHTPKKARIAGSDLVVELHIDRTIDLSTSAGAFLSEWLRFPREQRSEKWEAGQAGRKLVGDAKLDEIVSAWRQGPLKFSRAARHSVLLPPCKLEARDIERFPRRGSAWFARSAGADIAREFWTLAVKYFEPEFALLTTREEYHRKHCRYGSAADCQGIGTMECLHGDHVCETIPGVYWKTYLGPTLVARVGELQLRSIPVGQVQPFGDGYMLTAHDSPTLIGSRDALAREQSIIGNLGKQHFFRPNDKSTQRARYGSRTQRFAEENRKKPTEAEARFEEVLEQLDGGRLRGRFICQWPFGGKWILDAYIPELRLGFEVDGGCHNEPDQKERDRLKARDCADFGITLIRVTNEEVTGKDRDALAAKIRDAISEAGISNRRL